MVLPLSVSLSEPLAARASGGTSLVHESTSSGSESSGHAREGGGGAHRHRRGNAARRKIAACRSGCRSRRRSWHCTGSHPRPPRTHRGAQSGNRRCGLRHAVNRIEDSEQKQKIERRIPPHGRLLPTDSTSRQTIIAIAPAAAPRPAAARKGGGFNARGAAWRCGEAVGTRRLTSFC